MTQNQFFTTITKIIAWLDDMKIKNYTLVQHEACGFAVDVQGSVSLEFRGLEHIPVKFNCVTGRFNCDNNTLTHLDFAPISVGQTFNCGDNLLTSLMGAPITVGHDFLCWNNQLTNLMGCTQKIGADFYCNTNQLTTLRHGPQQVGGNFSVNNNNLKNLDYLPNEVGGSFNCGNNPSLGNYQKDWAFKELQSIVKIEKEKKLLSQTIHCSKQNGNVHKI